MTIYNFNLQLCPEPPVETTYIGFDSLSNPFVNYMLQ